jgi:RNA recognition motif-containing protein
MNLYVSNLGFHVSDEDLRKMFSDFGNVTSSKVITDKVTGRSRGFGFVEMASDDEGNNAIKDLDGKNLEGRTISVTVARPKAEKHNSFSGNRGGGGGGSRW